jgi:hypothetical protein
MSGDGAKIAACAAGGKDKMVSCLLGDKPEYKAAAQVVACVQGGRDASSLIANCSEFLIKDAKTRAALACAADAGSDRNKLLGCAASSVLPPEVARYAACAATSQGPTSFALCAAGPIMNEEWRIAAECAVQTGGNPVGFAGCTAGRLTLKELTQCFSGKGCFGPNNTIVKFYSNAFKDLLHGPGANNEIVMALHRLQEATGGPNSVINNPNQIFGGDNSMFRKPGQVFGGENSAVNKAARDIGTAAEHALHDVGKTGEKAAQDTGKAIETGAHDAGRAVEQGAHDAGKAIEQGAHGAGKAIEQGVQGVGKALGIGD